jgi:hypothetical protein
MSGLVDAAYGDPSVRPEVHRGHTARVEIAAMQESRAGVERVPQYEFDG